MFGTMAGRENPGPGQQENNWAQCLVDDLRVVQSPRGPRKVPRDGVMAEGGEEERDVVPRGLRSDGLFRGDTGTRHRGACYLTQLRTPKTATRGRGKGREAAVLIHTAVDGCRNEIIDRVARDRFD